MQRKRLKDVKGIRKKSIQNRKKSGSKNGLDGILKHAEIDVNKIPAYDPDDISNPIANPAVYKRFVDLVRKGNYLTTAAKAVNVSIRELKEALLAGQQGANMLFYNFWQDVRRAEAESEVERLETITLLAEEDGRLGLEILARRFPERWAKRTIKDLNHNNSNPERTALHREEFAKTILDDPEAREMARSLVMKANKDGVFQLDYDPEEDMLKHEDTKDDDKQD